MLISIECDYVLSLVAPMFAFYVLCIGAILKKKGEYIILCLSDPIVGGTLLWWNPNNSGYTTDLERAGRYFKKDVVDSAYYYNNGETTLAVPFELVWKLSQRDITVQGRHLNRMKSAARGQNVS